MSHMLISMPSLGTRYTYQSFWGSTVPPTTDPAFTNAQRGMRYRVAVAGRVVGLRYAREKRTSGLVVGQLFDDATRTLQRITLFRLKTVNGTGFDRWEHAYFRPWYRIAANTVVRPAIWFASVRPLIVNGGLVAADVTHGNITAIKDNTSGFMNGAVGTTFGSCPLGTIGGDTLDVDILFLPD